LFACGYCTNGQLGTGSTENCLNYTKIKIESLTEKLKIRNISCGGEHTIILLNDLYTILATGNN